MSLICLSRARGDVGRVPLCVFEVDACLDGADAAMSEADAVPLLAEIGLSRSCVPSGHYFIGSSTAVPAVPKATVLIESPSERRKRMMRLRGERFARKAKARADAADLARRSAEVVARSRALAAAISMRRVAEELARISSRDLPSRQQREFGAFVDAGLKIAEADPGALVAEIKRFGLGALPLHLAIEPALVSLGGGVGNDGRCFMGAVQPDAARRVKALLAAIKAGAGRAPTSLSLLPME